MKSGIAQEIQIYLDADGCAVKEEVYKVAERYQLKVFVVANKPLRIPFGSLLEMVTVSGDFDAADDWIVDHIESTKSIVVTADILLAQRCLEKGARVLGPKGEEFTEDNIGSAVATRELMQNLRYSGAVKGGPSPMNKTDRSRFLGKLDQIIQALRR